MTIELEKRSHRVCTFRFHNETEVRAAVPIFRPNGEQRNFQEMLALAKEISWQGDENTGRGGLRLFEVGPLITIP